MLQQDLIRNNKEKLLEGLKKRFVENAEKVVEDLQALVEKRNKHLRVLEDMRAKMNTLSKSIGNLYKEGKREEAEKVKKETSRLKESIKQAEELQRKLQAELQEFLASLPNLPHESVPVGKTAEDNVVVREFKGKILLEDALPHWELAVKRNFIDFETGSKITGSGFPLYVGKGAKLQRALINFFLDQAEKAGYTEYEPPVLVNSASAFGTGQLPDKDGQMYYVCQDNLYLVPTAEVPLTNIYRDTILSEEELPLKLTAYTPCFRREAGSYGKDVRGLNRLHQFDKVEIVQITTPEKSYEALEEMVEYVAGLLKMLELPFRIVSLCSGDLGFTSAKTYDMEVYSSAQKRWLEVSSISNFETYQSNRLKLRYRPVGEKKTRLVHTLNGSALALPRIVAAVYENFQDKEGTIYLPTVLHQYAGGEKL